MHEGPCANGFDSRIRPCFDGNSGGVLAQEYQGIGQAVQRHIEQAVRRFGAKYHSKKRRIGQRKPDIGDACCSEAGLSAAGPACRQTLCVSQFSQPFRPEGIQQRILVGKVPINGGCTDSNGPCDFTKAERISCSQLEQREARVDQSLSQITVMIVALFHVDTVTIAAMFIA